MKTALPYPTFGAVSAFCLVLYFLLGAMSATFGPLLPAIRDVRFDLTATEASALFTAWSLAGLAGAVVIGFADTRTSTKARLFAGLSFMLAGCLLAATATAWPVLVVASGCLGFAFSVLVVDVSFIMARGFGDKAASVINGVSSAFGVGAVAMPFLIGFAPTSVAMPFLAGAGVALALLVVLFALPIAASHGTGDKGASPWRWPGAVFLVGFGLLLAIYTAVEQGIGGWMSTHLVAGLAWDEADAARAVGLFWAGLTLGRLAMSPFASRFNPAVLVLTSIVLGSATLALAQFDALAIYAYLATGLFFAPFYPTTIVWLAQVIPSQRATAIALAISMLGPGVGAALIGLGFDTLGPRGVPSVLLAISGVVVALALVLLVTTRRRA